MVSLGARTPSEQVVVASEVMIASISDWYESKRNSKGTVHTNVMSAGLYLTEFLTSGFPLSRDIYATGSQMKGAGKSRAERILSDHGEQRPFTKEAGRTSRGTLGHADGLAEVINEAGKGAGVENFAEAERVDLAALLQRWFVGRTQEDFYGRQCIAVEIDPGNAVRATVAALLAAGRERGGTAAGAIAQHLVGAKLKIRFPEAHINGESYTTADAQTGRAGDYQIGDTAIHVTMSPSEHLFRDRCAHNLREDFRPRVLVPDASVPAAVALAELAGLEKKVAIQSIEDFVGTNIEETADFSRDGVRVKLRELLELYNERIEMSETDMSLKISIPSNL